MKKDIQLTIKDGEAIRKEWIDIDFCRKIEKLIDEYKELKYNRKVKFPKLREAIIRTCKHNKN